MKNIQVVNIKQCKFCGSNKEVNLINNQPVCTKCKEKLHDEIKKSCYKNRMVFCVIVSSCLAILEAAIAEIIRLL